MPYAPLYGTTLDPRTAGLAETSAGLFDSDDFTRANEELGVSADWTEDAGDWEVVSNRASEVADTAGTSVARFTSLAAKTVILVQGLIRRNNGNNGHYPGAGFNVDASGNGYQIYIGGTSGFSIRRSTTTTIAGVTTQGSASDTDHTFKLLVDGGANEQTAWFNESAAAGDKLEATDATYASGFQGSLHSTLSATTVDAEFDDLVYMLGNTLAVTGMTTGWKIRATFGAGTVTTTESGGTATIDADYRNWPITQIEVLDASDVVQATSSGLAIYGGAIWAFTAAGGNDAHIGTLDDPSTYTDDADSADPPTGGNTYPMEFLTQPFDVMEPGLEGWLTEITQNVEQLTGATIKIEIIANEGDKDAPTETKTLTLATGDAVVTRFPFRARGSQVRLRITISGFTSRVELGKMDLWRFGRRMGKRRQEDRR